MPTLDLTPPEQDLRLYARDDSQVTLHFWADEAKTTGFDFTGYTGWAGSVRSPVGGTSTLTVDTTNMASGVIVVTFDGSTLTTFPAKGSRWDLQAVTADARPVTLIQGNVAVEQDVTA